VSETLSQSRNLTARETEIIRILRVLTEVADGFVLIGGYAVNAYGQHRFSVDCDLATSGNNTPFIDTELLREGYELWKGRFRPPIGVTMRVYRKSVSGLPVSVDLFVNTVVSRRTRGTWTYKFIHENSVEAIVVGATDSTPSRVPNRNLLVAMKLHSGRTQDLADVVMLSERIDWETVARYVACGSREQLIAQIDSAIREISSVRFVSDVKSSFAMRKDPALLIKRASLGLRTLRTLVAEEKFKDSL
jgi:hypothetical protein